MERRVTSHTEEEEMNQRRHLLALARKGDQKAVNQLMELYQVRVYSGDRLKSLKIRKSLPVLSSPNPKDAAASAKPKPVKKHRVATSKSKATSKGTRPPGSQAKSASPKPARSKGKGSPERQTMRPTSVRKPKAANVSPKKPAKKVPAKGGVKKSGTRRSTAGTRVQPRTSAQSKSKAKAGGKVQVKKTRAQATKKAKSAPASKVKRLR